MVGILEMTKQLRYRIQFAANLIARIFPDADLPLSLSVIELLAVYEI